MYSRGELCDTDFEEVGAAGDFAPGWYKLPAGENCLIGLITGRHWPGVCVFWWRFFALHTPVFVTTYNWFDTFCVVSVSDGLFLSKLFSAPQGEKWQQSSSSSWLLGHQMALGAGQKGLPHPHCTESLTLSTGG